MSGKEKQLIIPVSVPAAKNWLQKCIDQHVANSPEHRSRAAFIISAILEKLEREGAVKDGQPVNLALHEEEPIGPFSPKFKPRRDTHSGPWCDKYDLPFKAATEQEREQYKLPENVLICHDPQLKNDPIFFYPLDKQ